MKIYMKLVLLLCLLLSVNHCYCQPISDLGAYNLYNNISKLATNMTVSKLDSKNNLHFFSMRQGAYDYSITLFSDENGYVSKISIYTNLPMLAVHELLKGDKASGPYYDDIYNYYRSKHISEEAASDGAAEKASKYQTERVKKLEQMLNIYGITGNNVINPTGVMLLSMLSEEGFDKFEYYTRFYDTPKDAYQKGINQFYVNKQLMTITNSGIASLYLALGLNNNELKILNSSFNADVSKVYCSKTNRNIYLKAATSFKGDFIKIDLSSQ